jgi:hypothetical protein
MKPKAPSYNSCAQIVITAVKIVALKCYIRFILDNPSFKSFITMQRRLHLSVFAVLLLLIKVSPALSQDIRFNKVTLPEEIIQGLITGITLDLQGNIWFGSGGLHKFDGVHLKSETREGEGSEFIIQLPST